MYELYFLLIANLIKCILCLYWIFFMDYQITYMPFMYVL